MTTETPMALEICLCGACEQNGHTKETYRPLTADEIAQREADALAYAEAQAAAAAEAARVAALKDSARAKLVSGTPLTAEEAALLVL